MATAIKFYLDENVPVAVAEQLQRRGIEAVTVRDLDARGDSDENHLSRAAEMGCVLCTHDADFIRLASSGMEHAGIVFGQQDRHGVSEWVKGLERLHASMAAHEMRNRVEYL